jgi:hypothetical protein
MGGVAEKHRLVGAAARFIDARLRGGCVAFALSDLVRETGLSIIAARNQLLRLGKKATRASRRQQFSLIIGREHQAMSVPRLRGGSTTILAGWGIPITWPSNQRLARMARVGWEVSPHLGRFGKPSNKTGSNWKSVFQAPLRRYNACMKNYLTRQLSRRPTRPEYEAQRIGRSAGSAPPEVVTLDRLSGGWAAGLRGSPFGPVCHPHLDILPQRQKHEG